MVKITNWCGQTVRLVDSNDETNTVVIEADKVGEFTVRSGTKYYFFIDNLKGNSIGGPATVGDSNYDLKNGNYIIYQSTPLIDDVVDWGDNISLANRYIVKGGIAQLVTATSFAAGDNVAFVHDPDVSLADYTAPVVVTETKADADVDTSSGNWWGLILVVIVLIVIVCVVIGVVMYRRHMTSN
jgi:hypothetical protein